MTRTLDSALLAAVRSDHLRPFNVVTLDYPLGVVRATSLPVNVVIDGQLHYGCGLVGELSEITEGGENRSYGFSATLSGIPNSFLLYLRNQDPHGRPATVSLGLCNAAYQLLAPPRPIKTGFIDFQTITVAASASVTVACEDGNVDWARARVRRWTHEDQQAAYSGDLYFDSIAAMQNINLRWGR